MAVSAAISGCPFVGHAQNLVWDTDPGTGLASGNGTWDTTTPNWTPDNGTTNVTFTDGSSVLFTQTGATITVSGTVSPDEITVQDDDFTLTGGTISDFFGTDIFVLGGQRIATINSTLAGTFSVAGSGTLVLGGSNTSLNLLTVSAGTSVSNLGTLGGTVSNSGDFTSTGTINTLVNNFGATANLSGTATGSVTNGFGGNLTLGTLVIDGTLGNSGILNGTGFTVGGDFTNTGSASVTGTFQSDVFNNGGQIFVTGDSSITGTLDNSAGFVVQGGNLSADTVSNDGTLTISAGRDLSTTLGLTNASGGDLNVNGTLTSAVINQSGGNVDLVGTITGGVTNSSGGTVNVQGMLDGALNNAGIVTSTGGTFTGPVSNAGTLNVSGGTFSDQVYNSGTISSDGSLTFGARLENDGTVDLSGNGIAGDVLTVNGDLEGNGTYMLDLSLDDDGTPPESDTIQVVGGLITGSVQLDFQLTGGSGATLPDDLLIVDADDAEPNAFNFSATGLPDTSQAVLYALRQDDAGNVFLFDQVNPAISAIAGNVALTQSLIGAVVNRPSSPFVTGLAYKDDKPCGTGVWARALVGHAETTGSTDNNADTIESRITADYHGIQLGGDFACFNGHIKGWDLAVGGIGGVNVGTTTQPVFALDPDTLEPLEDVLTSTTEGEFTQYYGGVYAIAVRDRLAIDLQYRVERTDFELSNEPVGGGAGLGLTDGEFSSTAQTLSGAVTYSIPISDTGFTLVPTAGFAYTRTKTGRITFDNGSELQVEDFDNVTGFAGASVSWTTVADSGTWALNRFVTGTYYNDFTDELESTFTDTGGIDTPLTSSNLGAYTELSGGLNFVKILQEGDLGSVRQINASLRGDMRFGEALDGWGVTGQVRFQF